MVSSLHPEAPPSTESRTPATWVGWALLVALPTLLGTAVSAALLVDYLKPVPVFCEPGGGCDRVKATSYAAWLGIPTPAFGLAAFLALGVLALLRGPRVRAMHAALATLSAVLCVNLIVVQLQMGAICKYCMVADFSALVLAGGALLRSVLAWDPPAKASHRFPVFATHPRMWITGALTLGAAAALPLAIGSTMKPSVPSVIAAEMRKTPAGKVTVIDFVDFECPFCRMTHLEFSPVLAANAANVRVVRKQVPLSMHEHARDAARTACCGELLGQGDRIADALFTAKDLTKEGCEKLAVDNGLDLAAYRSCIADPKTDARIEAERAEFKAARGKGLPTIWIDGEKLEGAQPQEKLEAALSRALSNKS
jgi:uncharacterized membrane protein/predicted DsbA family dithiol-disulfide isomerase